ncbi:DUF3263 domain-containing protein [Agromyces sp. CFH 90414]|uniref:DUF3263 domain-containing protein n=1 Tax=Agromyces agglutinans TaxID=2662258 RepID=A0A6I2FE97_9MICO|nr:DUF3263 domain-containing protein [Agromyces agglutinans]MRG61020.1 DUF3263 domain-containing protein [Agromyces agglutinans]
MGGATAPDGVGDGGGGRGPRDADGLDERAVRILEFEARSFGHPGSKAEAVRDEFGISAARYYRILDGLIDAPAALRHDPMLVKRLQRMRDGRAEARSRRTLTLGRRLD